MGHFVIVTFLRERWLHRLQAQSFGKFLRSNEDVKIHVVVNEYEDEAFNEFCQFFEDEIRPQFGVHSERVEVYSGNEIAPKARLIRGYDRQQVLKVRFVASLPCEWAIVLDSKNILIRPISWFDFFDAEQKPKAPFEDMKNHMFGKLVSKYYTLFGGIQDVKDSIFLATMTPFPMSPQYCMDMIEFLEKRTHSSFEAQFEKESAFKSEFLMYAAYLKDKVGPLENIYKNSPPLSWTVWPNHYIGHDALRNGLSRASENGKTMVGLHLRRVQQMSHEEIASCTNFFRSIGLLDANEKLQLQ